LPGSITTTPNKRLANIPVKRRLSETKLQAETAAAAQAAKYEAVIVQPAEAQHAKDLAAILLRVVTTPLWLHDGQICAGPLSGVSQTASSDPTSGGAPGTFQNAVR
jgi:hypothetical protein